MAIRHSSSPRNTESQDDPSPLRALPRSARASLHDRSRSRSDDAGGRAQLDRGHSQRRHALTDNQILHTAPTELTFRFDSSIAAEFAVQRQRRQHPDHARRRSHSGQWQRRQRERAGFSALGSTANDVIVRFANRAARRPVPDSHRRRRRQSAEEHRRRGLQRRRGSDAAFTLDLGAQVVAVVPQPITRDPSTTAADRKPRRKSTCTSTPTIR